MMSSKRSRLPAPPHEHEMKDTLRVTVFYPDHEAPRTESPTFRHMKAKAKREQRRCVITGQLDPQEHHVFIEWADAGFVDWVTVKRIAIGDIKELPVLDPDTMEPTGEMAPVEGFLIWMIIKLTEARGFDWHAFDPALPETFVDSEQNMLPLVMQFHIMKDKGIHMEDAPHWIVWGWPMLPDAVITPGEEQARLEDEQ